MVCVEGLEDCGAAEGVAGEEHAVQVHLPPEGGEVELILRFGKGEDFCSERNIHDINFQSW